MKRDLSRVEDQTTIHRYFSMIPKVIFTLGLPAHAIALYVALKQTAGEGGKSWKSTSTLAKESGMSAGMVFKMKKLLSDVHPLLGKPLIIIADKTTESEVDLITMPDIWGETMDKIRENPAPESHSPHERLIHPMNGSHSPHERNKISTRRTNEEEKKPLPLDLIPEYSFSNLPPEIDVPSVREVLKLWERHRIEKNKKLTPLSIKLQIEELRKLSHEQIVINVQHSIRQGYTGIYPPKTTNGNGNGHAQPREDGIFNGRMDPSGALG